MVPLFSTFPISKQIFFKSSQRTTYGVVNLKPLVKHPAEYFFHLDVLVIPARVVSRLSDLTTLEVTDLFLSVQTISRAIELDLKAPSMTIAIQDGPLAGQTVPHIHVHVIPRFEGDFKPLDAIYDKLDDLNLGEAQEKASRVIVDDEKRFARSDEAMKLEARYLSKLFEEQNRGFQ